MSFCLHHAVSAKVISLCDSVSLWILFWIPFSFWSFQWLKNPSIDHRFGRWEFWKSLFTQSVLRLYKILNNPPTTPPLNTESFQTLSNVWWVKSVYLIPVTVGHLLLNVHRQHLAPEGEALRLLNHLLVRRHCIVPHHHVTLKNKH